MSWKLFDERLTRKKALTERIAGPELAGVRRYMNDHPSEGLDPGSLAALLKEGETHDPSRYLAFAEEMEEKEPQYLSTLGTRKRAVSQLEITVERADDSDQADIHARMIESFLARDNLEDELFDMLDAIGKGFSLTEIEWEVSEKQWMPKKLHLVDPTWIEFDEIDLTTPFIKGLNGKLPLAPYKFIPFTLKAKSGIPMRSGLARAIAWIWMFKNFDVKSWAQFLETYGQPVRIGRFGAGATEAEKRALLRTVSALGRDFAGILPMGMAIEFQEASGKGATGALFQSFAEYLDKQISKVVLGQTMTTDDGSSQSQATVHNEVREDIERSDSRQLAAALNCYLVKTIIDLNFGPQQKYPQVRIGRAEHIDIEQFTTTAERLHRMGLKISKTQLYGTSGLIPPETDEDTLGFDAGGQEPGDKGVKGKARDPEDVQDEEEKKDTASLQADAPPPGPIEVLVDTGTADGTAIFRATLMKSVADLATSVDTYDEFVDRLTDILDRPNDGDLIEHMAQAAFMARAAGVTGLDEEDDGEA